MAVPVKIDEFVKNRCRTVPKEVQDQGARNSVSGGVLVLRRKDDGMSATPILDFLQRR